jgi:hypothetical protein
VSAPYEVIDNWAIKAQHGNLVLVVSLATGEWATARRFKAGLGSFQYAPPEGSEAVARADFARQRTDNRDGE